MLRQLMTLTLAAGLLAPLAASAQTPAAPPAAPTPAAPAARNAHRVNGKITDVDAAKKTVTVTVHRKPTTVSVSDSTKIFKADDTKKDPTGTFADLTVGVRITATTDGDAAAPTARVIHIRAAKTAAPVAPAAPAPATPAPPATPATP